MARTLLPNEKLRMVYHRMVQSCTDQNHASYPRYGGKGVYVDKTDWPNAAAFVAWAWESGYVADAGLSIDRIDSLGPYSKANCRWASRKTQQRNMQTNRRFDYQGQELTVGEILELTQGGYTQVERNRLYYRLTKGWPMWEALQFQQPTESVVRQDLAPQGQKKYALDGQLYSATGLIIHFWGECSEARYCLFYRRLKKGWDYAKAASTPALVSRYDARNAAA